MASMLDGIAKHTSPDFIVTGGFLFILYLIGSVIYQLHFSPLSKFPGPKIAAATLWYEIYYDVFKWGRYWVEIQKMHEKYGPIVRISPYELHVSDPSFIDTLYTRAAPRDKHHFMTGQFGNDLTTFSTDDHYHHRIRRGALNPFFSKQRVSGLQDLIWTHVEKLCKRFEEHKAAGKPLPATDAFGCLTADIIIQYSMGLQQKALDDPDFAPLFTQAVKKFASMGVYAKHMPWIHTITHALPQDWIAKASPEYGAMLAFRHMNKDRVQEIFDRKEKAEHMDVNWDAKDPETHTIFDDLLDSDLPPVEKDLERLSQESQVIVGAGLDTTANALNATLYHLLATPSTIKRLKAELATAMPIPTDHIPLITLEKLPYLTGVINEGLRLSHGLSCRNARLAHSSLLYKSHVIPAYTPVSMSAPFTHHDESIFPDSHAFIPERWLDSTGAAVGGKTPDGRPLERFLMTFGKGARQCVGINLARAELYIAVAALVGRFNMELWESTRRDIDFVHDLFLPQVDLRSRGVKVLVK